MSVEVRSCRRRDTNGGKRREEKAFSRCGGKRETNKVSRGDPWAAHRPIAAKLLARGPVVR